MHLIAPKERYIKVVKSLKIHKKKAPTKTRFSQNRDAKKKKKRSRIVTEIVSSGKKLQCIVLGVTLSK